MSTKRKKELVRADTVFSQFNFSENANAYQRFAILAAMDKYFKPTHKSTVEVYFEVARIFGKDDYELDGMSLPEGMRAFSVLGAPMVFVNGKIFCMKKYYSSKREVASDFFHFMKLETATSLERNNDLVTGYRMDKLPVLVNRDLLVYVYREKGPSGVCDLLAETKEILPYIKYIFTHTPFDARFVKYQKESKAKPKNGMPVYSTPYAFGTVAMEYCHEKLEDIEDDVIDRIIHGDPEIIMRTPIETVRRVYACWSSETGVGLTKDHMVHHFKGGFLSCSDEHCSKYPKQDDAPKSKKRKKDFGGYYPSGDYGYNTKPTGTRKQMDETIDHGYSLNNPVFSRLFPGAIDILDEILKLMTSGISKDSATDAILKASSLSQEQKDAFVKALPDEGSLQEWANAMPDQDSAGRKDMEDLVTRLGLNIKDLNATRDKSEAFKRELWHKAQQMREEEQALRDKLSDCDAEIQAGTAQVSKMGSMIRDMEMALARRTNDINYVQAARASSEERMSRVQESLDKTTTSLNEENSDINAELGDIRQREDEAQERARCEEQALREKIMRKRDELEDEKANYDRTVQSLKENKQELEKTYLDILEANKAATAHLQELELRKSEEKRLRMAVLEQGEKLKAKHTRAQTIQNEVIGLMKENGKLVADNAVSKEKLVPIPEVPILQKPSTGWKPGTITGTSSKGEPIVVKEKGTDKSQVKEKVLSWAERHAVPATSREGTDLILTEVEDDNEEMSSDSSSGSVVSMIGGSGQELNSDEEDAVLGRDEKDVEMKAIGGGDRVTITSEESKKMMEMATDIMTGIEAERKAREAALNSYETAKKIKAAKEALSKPVKGTEAPLAIAAAPQAEPKVAQEKPQQPKPLAIQGIPKPSTSDSLDLTVEASPAHNTRSRAGEPLKAATVPSKPIKRGSKDREIEPAGKSTKKVPITEGKQQEDGSTAMLVEKDDDNQIPVPPKKKELEKKEIDAAIAYQRLNNPKFISLQVQKKADLVRDVLAHVDKRANAQYKLECSRSIKDMYDKALNESFKPLRVAHESYNTVFLTGVKFQDADIEKNYLADQTVIETIAGNCFSAMIAVLKKDKLLSG